MKPAWRRAFLLGAFFLAWLRIFAEEYACVWEARQGGAELWLVGSMHVLTKEDHPLPPVIEKVYRRCSKLIFEVDPATIKRTQSAKSVKDFTTLPNNRPVWGELDPENRESLLTYLSLSGRNPGEYRNQRPWFVAARLVSEEYARFGGEERYGLESTLESWASRDRKSVSGLESMGEQFRIFGQLSPAIEAQLMRRTLGEIGGIEETFQSLRNAWKAGNLDTLGSILFAGKEEFPDLLDAMYATRNTRWLPKIQELSGEASPVMLTVGVGHLLGDQGLPVMLARQGWQVRRVLLKSEGTGGVKVEPVGF